MLPIRWDPFRDMTRELSNLHREMNDLFHRTFTLQGAPTEGGFTLFVPVINTFNKGETFCLQAELPGVTKDDLELSIEGNMLILRGERKENRDLKESDYMIRESQYGSFVRRIPLPEGVRSEEIEARFADGMLTVTMPLTTPSKGRKILIEGAEENKKGKEIH